MSYKIQHQLRVFLLVIIVMLGLNCCAEWSSTPTRVQSNYGESVRSLVSNQIYNPQKAKNPATLAPDGMEGNKADAVLNSTYRGLIFVPKEDLRHITTYGQPGINHIGSTGGSSR
jgi:hypothetical protein